MTANHTHRALVSFFLMTLIVACSGEQSEDQTLQVPQGIIPPDSMALFMADIQVLEAAIRSREVRKQKLQDEARVAYIGYFDTAAVSKDRFMKSLDHWKNDFGIMETIYDDAMEILSTRVAKEKKQEEEEGAQTEGVAKD